MITPLESTPARESTAALAASELGDVFPALRMTPAARTRPAALHNTIAVRELADGASALLFYGRRFDVPPVPYVPGVELDSIRRRLMQITVDGAAGDLTDEQIVTERLALFDRCVAIFPELVRAHGRLHRWTIRLFRINPFRRSSEKDIFELLGFFSACRSRSGVRHR